jgi:hypothetical protein
MEKQINDYLSYHSVNEFRQRNLLYTWMLWNYNKLTLLFENETKFKDKMLFDSLVKEVNNDILVNTLTNGGRFRACSKSDQYFDDAASLAFERNSNIT